MKRAMVSAAVVTMLLAAAVRTQGQDKTQPQLQPRTPGAAAPTPPAPQGKLVGNWQGTLQLDGGRGLRTILKVSEDDGKYRGQMYSIDQGPGAVAMTSVSLDGLKVAFEIKPFNLTYAGTLSPDGNSIAGSATQNGQTHVLNLDHVSEENTWAIPEAPKPMAKDARPKFDVATVKPRAPDARPGKNIGFQGRQFLGRNFNVDDMLALGYGLHTRQIVGGPDWFDSELFDIEGVPDTPGVPSMKQMAYLMQDLLATRFGLKFHHEQRELSVFAITVGKGGPKMQVSAAGPDDSPGFGFRRLGDLTVRNMTMADFAIWFQGSVTDRPIVDQTGLKDRYDFTLKWTPDDSQFAQFRSTGALPTTTDDPNAPPALNDAMQQQLGLHIEAVKAMDDVIVIDHAEHPGAN